MFHITPSVGIDLDYNSTDLPYADRDTGVPTPALGTKVIGSDGHEYVFVKASAAITADSDVTITEPAMTAADGGGSGTYEVGVAVESGAYFWARKSAI